MFTNLFFSEKKPEQDSKLLDVNEIVEPKTMITLFWGMYEVPEAKLFLVIMSLRNLFSFFVAIYLKFKEFNWYTKFI
jgi:hypothetical protein